MFSMTKKIFLEDHNMCHEGHEISEQNYFNQNRGIYETDKAMVSEMLNVQTLNK